MSALVLAKWDLYVEHNIYSGHILWQTNAFFLTCKNSGHIGFLSSYILRRPQNFAKSLPIIWQIWQIIGGDFAKFCGLLRIYELYKSCPSTLF